MTDVSFITKTMVTTVYDDLLLATTTWTPLQKDYLVLKEILENKVSTALANGSIEGKNADMRKANARDLYYEDYKGLALAKDSADLAKLSLDLAAIRKSHVLSLLRLAEIIVQAEANEHPAE